MENNSSTINTLDEYYLDVQGSGTIENVADVIAKVGASIIVLWFSFNELIDELGEYKKLRRNRRDDNGSSS